MGAINGYKTHHIVDMLVSNVIKMPIDDFYQLLRDQPPLQLGEERTAVDLNQLVAEHQRKLGYI